MGYLRPVSLAVVAMSGGVDSAVSAILLRSKGYDVHGVFMRNWDVADEQGLCSADSDWASVKEICRKLHIPCKQVDLTKEYWAHVFDPFLDDIRKGEISNPDIRCNRMIKFGAFVDRCRKEFASVQGLNIAFGHYARLKTQPDGSKLLLKARDTIKDQTYFLSKIDQKSLTNVLFPVGDLLKSQVKAIARAHGLDRVAQRPESTGICFIGPRPFGDFIEQYVEQKPGKFIDRNGKVLGDHRGLGRYTIGQRAAISGTPTKLFVARKNVETNTITVVASPTTSSSLSLSTDNVNATDCAGDANMLYRKWIRVVSWHWICGDVNDLDAMGVVRACEDGMRVTVKIRSQMQPVPARMLRTPALSSDSHGDNNSTSNDAIKQRSGAAYVVVFDTPQRGVAPGQMLVAYNGDVCLGGGRMVECSATPDIRILNTMPSSPLSSAL